MIPVRSSTRLSNACLPNKTALDRSDHSETTTTEQAGGWSFSRWLWLLAGYRWPGGHMPERKARKQSKVVVVVSPADRRRSCTRRPCLSSSSSRAVLVVEHDVHVQYLLAGLCCGWSRASRSWDGVAKATASRGVPRPLRYRLKRSLATGQRLVQGRPAGIYCRGFGCSGFCVHHVQADGIQRGNGNVLCCAFVW